MAGSRKSQARCVNCHSETMLDTEYLFRVDRGSTARPHDNGIVAVVDGSESYINDILPVFF